MSPLNASARSAFRLRTRFSLSTSRPPRLVALLLLLPLCLPTLHGQITRPLRHDAADQVDLPREPAEIYTMNCSACHGEDGAGAPATRLGFDLPLPDFTDCDFAKREANADWLAVASRGGPVRAFSRMMPALGDAMTEEEMRLALRHIRSFCADPAWPRGELNLPRALYTTKAYPEDEMVIDTTWDTTDAAENVTSRVLYEQRFGKRSQFEVIIPWVWQETANEWEAGLGDVGIGVKSALWHDWEKGYILSPGLEVLLPTGDDDRGLGSGTTRFEPYLSYGQLLGDGWFTQAQVGAAIPIDGAKAPEEVFARMAVGKAIYEGGYGRRWSPILELLWSDELGDGSTGNWDLAPQLQVTLSTRQHVRLAAGARIPLNKAGRRDPQFTVYLLWDWFDGGFFEGW